LRIRATNAESYGTSEDIPEIDEEGQSGSQKNAFKKKKKNKRREIAEYNDNDEQDD
jgi:hypothetical protein